MASAALTDARRRFGPLVDHFGFYASYHNNAVNQLIHVICVPLILATALVFLSHIDASPYLPESIAKQLVAATGFSPSAALFIAIGYALYYLYLSPSVLGLSAAAIVMGEWFGAETWSQSAGAAVWTPATVIHVIAWIAQFYGHGVHEGRSPALLDNLFQALFMAPLFVWIEVLMHLGFLADFKKAITPIVAASIAEFRARKAGNGPTSTSKKGK